MFGVCVDTWCYIILLYIILLYYYILLIFLLFPILYSLLFYPFSSPLLLHSKYTCRYLHILIYILLFSSPLPIYLLFSLSSYNNPFSSSPLPLLSSPSPLHIYLQFYPNHSKYTCRVFHLLIYVLSISHQQSDPACFIGVDG